MRWLVIGAIALGLVVRRCDDPAPAARPLRFATFNIENFPKDRRQIDGAFDEIVELDASFVAVQEISDPALLLATARRRLGSTWDFVHTDTRPAADAGARYVSHHIGVLYDREVWTVVAVASHDDTRIGRHKPTLEVALRPRAGGPIVRAFVVHLRSGSEARDDRARQLAALGELVRRVRATHPDDHVVVLGDFNATADDDRRDIAAIASRTGLTWATEPLACSAFWDRDDGCPRSRLDHVLTWAPPASVEAAGGCARDGCDWQASCPVYAEHVSDHCPVVVDFAAGP